MIQLATKPKYTRPAIFRPTIAKPAVEAILRDTAFVLQMTAKVKAQILQKRTTQK